VPPISRIAAAIRSCCWLSSLLRYRDGRGDDCAGLSDFPPMRPMRGGRSCACLGRSVERAAIDVPRRPEQIHEVEPPFSRLGTQGIEHFAPRFRPIRVAKSVSWHALGSGHLERAGVGDHERTEF
jgi:hypothetical protein